MSAPLTSDVETDFEARVTRAIEAYVAAFNGRDLTTLAALLTDDVVLVDWAVDASGKADVMAVTKQILSDAKIRADLVRLVCHEPFCVAELLIHVGTEACLEVLDLYRFRPDGLIDSIRAFKGPERSA